MYDMDDEDTGEMGEVTAQEDERCVSCRGVIRAGEECHLVVATQEYFCTLCAGAR